MGDLDSLLQDFSYLKSLEHKNQAPKRVHKKLHVGCASGKHAMRVVGGAPVLVVVAATAAEGESRWEGRVSCPIE